MDSENQVDQVSKSTKKQIYKKWWFWVIIVVVVLAIIGGGAGAGAKNDTDTPKADSGIVEDTVTLGEKNALRSAKSYTSTLAFSREGLIDQLLFEGYSNEEAVYGVDNCGADWFDQAKKSAASYLRSMSFSREGLIHQLEYEKFTHEQAVYGAEANGY